MATTASFAIAFAAVGVMGFAIQRGATCTVAAMEEIVVDGRFSRLIALVEAALWVGGGLVVLSAFGILEMAPAGYAPAMATLAGGVLLGFGAFINRACVFGSIAKLGSGGWAYAATPLGFFLGCALVASLPLEGPRGLTTEPFAVSSSLAIICLILFAARLVAHGRTAIGEPNIAAHIWSPHVATTIIGVSFLAALLSAGSWTYTELLARLAQGDAGDVCVPVALFAALLAGAILGGWTAGRLRAVMPNGTAIARCLAGGAMMGVGSSLIPGGNDGLILVGMPLLWPYAWLAFAAMCSVILLALRLSGTSKLASLGPAV